VAPSASPLGLHHSQSRCRAISRSCWLTGIFLDGLLDGALLIRLVKDDANELSGGALEVIYRPGVVRLLGGWSLGHCEVSVADRWPTQTHQNMPRSLLKGSRHCRFADHPKVSVTPSSTAWSRSPGMGGRNQSERMVAINRNRWSQSAGAPILIERALDEAHSRQFRPVKDTK
jgi:hypothetical protein